MSEPPRLFLITPPIADAAGFLPRLEAALDAADVACLLLRAAADGSDPKAMVRLLAPAAQGRGVAVLIEGDPRFAARTDADGLHVAAGGTALEDALDSLKPKKIVGAGRLVDRDAAMAAGESGVDYLMFGGPDEADDIDTVLERVAWWAEIFNVPCVGYAGDPREAAAVARAGAEFVALCDGVWDDPAAVLTAVTRDLAAVPEPAR